MALVRIQKKGTVTLPVQLRNRLGLVEGDLIDVRLQGSTSIVIKPQIVIDRFKFPIDDEYTPEQRQAIQADLKEARKGPYFGPFKDGDEVAAFLKVFKRRRASSRKTKKAR